MSYERHASRNASPESHRAIKLVSILLMASMCMALFGISWFVQGEPPWRSASMAAILIGLVVTLRLIEPWARKNAKAHAIQRQPVPSVNESQNDTGSDR